GAGGALRVRPAAESEWLTCGAGSRVSACGKYADLCRQRTARAATRTTTRTRTAIITNAVTNGEPKQYAGATGAGSHWEWDDFLIDTSNTYKECEKNRTGQVRGVNCSIWFGSSNDKGVSSSSSEQYKPNDGTRTEDLTSVNENKPGVAAEHPAIPSAASELNAEIPSTTEGQGEESTKAKQSNEEASSNQADNTTSADSNPNQQPPATVNATAAPVSHETNSTTPPRTESTVGEAPTNTSSPVPVTDSQMSNTIASTVQNKPNVDSSVSPVWMRTAVPLLIVVVLFSATVY
ncbi:uncharacterized protein TM35_000471590, partial [Trypanosoma theileri]